MRHPAKSVRFGALLLLLAGSVFLGVGRGAARPLLGNSGITDAVMRNDWADVLQRLQAVPVDTLDIPSGLLSAHALLALNRCDEAAARFLSFSAWREDTSWRDFTADLAAAQPGSATAHYLAGDALARLGDTAGALKELDLAVSQDSTCWLARNARGVLRAVDYQGREDPAADIEILHAALADFRRVSRDRPEFLDAWLNRAITHLTANQFEGARECFDRAASLSRGCALADNGRAVLRLHSGDLEGARRDIIHADSLLPGYPYIVVNARSMLAGDSETGDPLFRIARLDRAIAADSTRGWSSATWADFGREFKDFGLNTLASVGGMMGGDPSAIYNSWDRTFDSARNLGSFDYSTMFGGVYLDVQMLEGTRKVAATYALGYGCAR